MRDYRKEMLMEWLWTLPLRCIRTRDLGLHYRHHDRQPSAGGHANPMIMMSLTWPPSRHWEQLIWGLMHNSIMIVNWIRNSFLSTRDLVYAANYRACIRRRRRCPVCCNLPLLWPQSTSLANWNKLASYEALQSLLKRRLSICSHSIKNEKSKRFSATKIELFKRPGKLKPFNLAFDSIPTTVNGTQQNKPRSKFSSIEHYGQECQ